ncbi:MAG: hypothetical protein LBD79_06880 [Treponema sp.]|jgi:hypothetical protein|nr:hypothetical protein [Treponema sp.]
MKKTLYKPEADEVDVNVVTYANEAFIDWRCKHEGGKNTTGCGKNCKGMPWPGKGIDFICKTSGKINWVCPKG